MYEFHPCDDQICVWTNIERINNNNKVAQWVFDRASSGLESSNCHVQLEQVVLSPDWQKTSHFGLSVRFALQYSPISPSSEKWHVNCISNLPLQNVRVTWQLLISGGYKVIWCTDVFFCEGEMVSLWAVCDLNLKINVYTKGSTKRVVFPSHCTCSFCLF